MEIYRQTDRAAECRTGLYVIIPVYNCNAYLRAAVQSVLDQPYKEIEIVLVDDGSTDGSSELCDVLKEENNRIHVLHQANAGVSAARNAGLALVYDLSGRDGAPDQSYTAFLDADDFWCPETLRADYLQEPQDFSDRTDPQELSDIIGFSTLYSNTKGERFRSGHQYAEERIEVPERGTVGWIWGGHLGAHLYRTDFLKEFLLAFIEGCKANEDVIFTRQAVFCASSLQFKPEPLYVYRRNTASVCHNPEKEIEAQLALPRYWAQVKDWSDRYEGISQQSRQEWKADCTAYAGGRTLEAIGTLIGFGCNLDEVLETVRAVGLMPYLERLRPEELSDWQKPDLRLYREDLNGFIKKHKKSVWHQRLRQIIINLPFFTAVYDRKRYPLDKDKMEGLS